MPMTGGGGMNLGGSGAGINRVAKDITPNPLDYAREFDRRKAEEATRMNIIEAVRDPRVFGPAFRDRTHGRLGSRSSPRCSGCRWTRSNAASSRECTATQRHAKHGS